MGDGMTKKHHLLLYSLLGVCLVIAVGFAIAAQRGKRHFFLSLHTEQPLPERLRQYYEHLREREVSFERLHKNRKK